MWYQRDEGSNRYVGQLFVNLSSFGSTVRILAACYQRVGPVHGRLLASCCQCVEPFQMQYVYRHGLVNVLNI